jgi:hypothetical protein
MSERLPSFTFIVPVRNERARIDRCLASIRAQDYPADLIEILVPDQGSTDDTRDRAQAFGARVTENPVQRAIFSMPRAFDDASGELIAVVAADNPVAPSYCRRMAEPFSHPDVRLAFPFVTTDRPDYSLAVRYVNRFTDPFNHFLYGAASNPRDLPRAYRPVLASETYDLYRFPADRPPLLAIAQGAVVRAPFRMPEGYADDVGCILDLLRTGALAACVKAPLVDHYTADGLGDLLAKFRPRVAKNIKPDSSLRWRDRYLPDDRLRRRTMWPVYAASLCAPCVVALWRAAADREPLWLYHPVMTLAFAWIVAGEAAKNLGHAVNVWTRRSAEADAPSPE